jgi:hypothetical protein
MNLAQKTGQANTTSFPTKSDTYEQSLFQNGDPLNGHP